MRLWLPLKPNAQFNLWIGALHNWCPTGFKCGINYQPPTVVPGGDLAKVMRPHLAIPRRLQKFSHDLTSCIPSVHLCTGMHGGR